jgi:uncharacterized protein YhfF
MTPEIFWSEYCRTTGADPGITYDVWYFGDKRELADRLAELVLSGQKRATACLAGSMNTEPAAGQVSIVTNFDGEPKCIIRLTDVKTVPFDEVDASFAFDEGEGDRTLEDWRRGHWNFFSRCLEPMGKQPDLRMLVTCQRFEVVYPVISAKQ